MRCLKKSFAEYYAMAATTKRQQLDIPIWFADEEPGRCVHCRGAPRSRQKYLLFVRDQEYKKPQSERTSADSPAEDQHNGAYGV